MRMIVYTLNRIVIHHISQRTKSSFLLSTKRTNVRILARIGAGEHMFSVPGPFPTIPKISFQGIVDCQPQYINIKNSHHTIYCVRAKFQLFLKLVISEQLRRPARLSGPHELVKTNFQKNKYTCIQSSQSRQTFSNLVFFKELDYSQNISIIIL